MSPRGEELWRLPAGCHRAAAGTDTSSISSLVVEGSTGIRSPEEGLAQHSTAWHNLAWQPAGGSLPEVMLHQSAGAEAGRTKSRAAVQEYLGSARGFGFNLLIGSGVL